MAMFWGLTVEPKKKYTQIVEESFTVTSAALDTLNSKDNGNTVLCLVVDKQEFVLCTLNKDKWPQHAIQLPLEEGQEISFFVRGNSSIHLTGFSDPDMGDGMDGMDDEELMDGMYSDEDGEFDDSEDDDSKVQEEEDEWESDSDDAAVPPQKAASKRELPAPAKPAAAKKMKIEAVEQEKAVAPAKQDKKAAPQKAEKKVAEPKKEKQQPKAPEVQKTEKLKGAKLEGGTIVEDVTVGSGPKAKAGKMVGVYYVGRLAQNNKIFDACKDGKPFKFRLAKGEVIKGWDVGVNGMQVGGKRVLKIPPGQAYGARGAPPTIPPNSTLIFEVELKSVK